MTSDEFRELLVQHGWQISSYKCCYGNNCDWFALLQELRNGRLSMFVLTPYNRVCETDVVYTLDLVAAIPSRVWADSLTTTHQSDMWRQEFPTIKARLIAHWLEVITADNFGETK